MKNTRLARTAYRLLSVFLVLLMVGTAGCGSSNRKPSLTLAITPTSATEGDGILVGQAAVTIPNVQSGDLVVNLTCDDTIEATIPASVTILTGNLSAAFDITVNDDAAIDGTKTCTVTCSAPGWNNGSDTLAILDNESQTLSAAITPVEVTEGDGVVTGQAMVSIPGTFASDLVINLASSDTSELTVPATATIIAGTMSATFDMTVIDDTAFDGTQPVTVTASVTDWTSGNDNVNVLDNESQTFTVDIIPVSADEVAGVLVSQGTVTIPGTWMSDLVVSLASDDTSEATVSPTCTIVAGTTSASFDISIVDDTQIDGSQTVTLTVSAAGWTSGNDSIIVLDNETQTLTCMVTPVSATEGDGSLVGQGMISIPGTWASDLVVTLSSSDTTELTVPTTVTIPAGSTSTLFDLTVVDDNEIDGTRSVVIDALVAGWISGSDNMDILDNESQTLTLAVIPPDAVEGTGLLANQGSVSIPGTWASDLVVTLSSSDTTELTVPATVTIPAGSTSALFDLTVVDDGLIDGAQLVTVTASVTGWTPGNDSISVTDNESQTLTLSITPASASEAAGILAGQASVSIPGTYASNLVVSLTSSDTTELTVPATATILAGATSVTFDLTIINDTVVDGPQTVTVTASVSGWTPGNDTIIIQDNEPRILTLNVIPTTATEGDGVLAGQGVVSIAGTWSSDLVVGLLSEDTSEITVPGSVTIPAGSTSASFDITIVDDTAIDGTQIAAVVATSFSWTPGTDSISILDNENVDIIIIITGSVEGDGVLPNAGKIQISGTLTRDLVFTLTSSDTTELTVPPSVTIPAGSTSVFFDITIVDDNEIDGTKVVTITVSTLGFNSASITHTVEDNESQTIDVSLPVGATEGDGVIANGGQVLIPGTWPSDLVITLTSSDTTELAVPATVTIPAGSTSANFDITVIDDLLIDGTQMVSVTAFVSGWASGSNGMMDILDNETKTLTLAIIPTIVTEGDGVLIGQGTVSIDGTYAGHLDISLTSSDTSELAVPASVMIHAGNSSATFDISVVDDAIVDGAQPVNVTASIVGWTPGNDSLTVFDNESPTITVNITPVTAAEGDPVISGQASVSIPIAEVADLVIAVESSDTTELTVPASVTIFAGNTSALFDITIVDDTEIDGTQTVTVSATAAGHNPGSDVISVTDNEVMALALNLIPASATEGDGVLLNQGVISIPGTMTVDLIINLVSSDVTELSVPATVTILAGSASANFNLTVRGDALLDGTQTVTVTASLAGWTPASDTMDIVDSPSAVFYLRADVVTKTMPDSQVVTMWGYALDSGFGAMDGTVTVPGPRLNVPTGAASVFIELDNNLPVPTSLVIPGQTAELSPVNYPNGRVRSFTHETPPGNTTPVEYAIESVRPGTCVYSSGTDPAVQIQMGLYGALTRDSALGEAYPGVSYTNEVVLFYSEIDPALHNAVATDNYGPGKSVTSTINYAPRYFLVNGEAYSAGRPDIPACPAGSGCLIRFINMGLKSHAPMISNLYMNVVAEDGFVYGVGENVYSLFLPAGKTKDVFITPPSAGTYTVFDRMHYLSNGAASPGGMLVKLTVSP